MPVVSNTTPLNYLLLIGEVNVLREVYGRVVIPQAVFDELQHTETPANVRRWIADCPEWIEVHRLSPV